VKNKNLFFGNYKNWKIDWKKESTALISDRGLEDERKY
jgi:hypothetical protein